MKIIAFWIVSMFFITFQIEITQHNRVFQCTISNIKLPEKKYIELNRRNPIKKRLDIFNNGIQNSFLFLGDRNSNGNIKDQQPNKETAKLHSFLIKPDDRKCAITQQGVPRVNEFESFIRQGILRHLCY